MNNRVTRCLLPPSIMWLLGVRDENDICLFTPRYGMFSTIQAILKVHLKLGNAPMSIIHKNESE